jgi:hypothetical protein
MKYETAGDPITGLKWTRKTTEKIANELKSINIRVCSNTVARLLKDMDFSLRVNEKKIASGGKKITPEDQKKRDEQFNYIGDLREQFSKEGLPIISVDTKKKESIGNFKNQGATWGRTSKPVNDHDFPSYAVGKGIPFGVYDTIANLGSVYLGTTHDTPSFAVDSIAKWWEKEGCKRYPDARELYVLADSGGSNSSRSRVWKYRVQEKLSDTYGLSITVSHYPPGTSKWNPIEHRLFSEISKNWAGEPLETYEKTLKWIRTTKTSTGLKVKAHFVRKHYKTGEKVSNSQMDSLSISPHVKFPSWNYTINPRSKM